MATVFGSHKRKPWTELIPNVAAAGRVAEVGDLHINKQVPEITAVYSLEEKTSPESFVACLPVPTLRLTRIQGPGREKRKDVSKRPREVING
jgi:hypothetical protein